MKSFHHNNVQAKKKHKVNTVKRIGNRFLTDRRVPFQKSNYTKVWIYLIRKDHQEKYFHCLFRLNIVKETGYESRQTSKVKSTVL